jgi:hypothetical protein
MCSNNNHLINSPSPQLEKSKKGSIKLEQKITQKHDRMLFERHLCQFQGKYDDDDDDYVTYQW